MRFPGRDRRINIPQRIGTQYGKFSILLLEDDTGSRVTSLFHKYSNDAERISTEVLQEWIAGKGKHPVTWKTLVEVLHDIDHNALAAEIGTVKCECCEHLSLLVE